MRWTRDQPRWNNESTRTIFSRALGVDCDGSSPLPLYFFTFNKNRVNSCLQIVCRVSFTKSEILDGWSEANQAAHSNNQVIHQRKTLSSQWFLKSFCLSLSCLCVVSPARLARRKPQIKLKHICEYCLVQLDNCGGSTVYLFISRLWGAEWDFKPAVALFPHWSQAVFFLDKLNGILISVCGLIIYALGWP